MWQGGHAPSPISIHAPPRGATCRNMHCRLRSGNFNSRPSARGDAAARNCPDHHAGFQFTPLREGRPDCPAGAANAQHFNSRPSARGDFAASESPGVGKISIHAPPRGATGQPHLPLGGHRISIHAPPRGATRFDVLRGNAQLFQFTPLREGRPV